MVKSFAILLALAAAPLRAQTEQGLQDEFALRPSEAVLSDRFALRAIFAIEMAYKLSVQSDVSATAVSGNTQRLQALKSEVETLGEWLVCLKTTSYVIAEEENALQAHKAGKPLRLPDQSACRDELLTTLSQRRASPVYLACSLDQPQTSPTAAVVKPPDRPYGASAAKKPRRRELVTRQPIVRAGKQHSAAGAKHKAAPETGRGKPRKKPRRQLRG